MSGGSHNYLCYAEVEYLYERIDDLEIMERDLIRLGYPDIAKDVRRLIEYIHSARNRIEVLFGSLKDVFHAVEWQASADIDMDRLVEQLEKYRNGE